LEVHVVNERVRFGVAGLLGVLLLLATAAPFLQA
jgi:hypothetical protein